MIKDFADFDDGATLAADNCIVGGGAAGANIVQEFIGPRGTAGLGNNHELVGRPYTIWRSFDQWEQTSGGLFRVLR